MGMNTEQLLVTAISSLRSRMEADQGTIAELQEQLDELQRQKRPALQEGPDPVRELVDNTWIQEKVARGRKSKGPRKKRVIRENKVATKRTRTPKVKAAVKATGRANRLSAAARKRIAEAQAERWRKHRERVAAEKAAEGNVA